MNTDDPKTQGLDAFLRALHDAEISFQEGGPGAFSRKAMLEVLTKFCNTVAQRCNAESCTIQLKLHDPKNMPISGSEGILDTWAKARAPAFETSDKNIPHSQKARTRRMAHLKSSLTFPFWKFGKGALELVATNQDPDKRQPLPLSLKDGPWAAVLLDPDPSNYSRRINPLDRGLTTRIIQDTTSRIQDAFDISKGRNCLKLGGVDNHVWTNETWRHIFRSFCGVPIRIHSTGEVVGVLKLENKHFPSDRRAAIEEKLATAYTTETTTSSHGLLQNFLAAWEGNSLASNADAIPYRTDISFLSLSYILDDFEADSKGTNRNEPFQRLYPTSLAERNGPGFDSLNASTAPLQLWGESLNAETRFLSAIGALSESNEESKTVNLGPIRTARKYLQDMLPSFLALAKEKPVEITLSISSTTTLQLVVTPAPTEIEESIRSQAFKITFNQSPRDFTLYCLLPPDKTEPILSVTDPSVKPQLKGMKWQHPDATKVPPQYDWIVDRIAARAQSFVRSIPFPSFNQEDYGVLSSAAYEIGKLIEKQIAYRASLGDTPMPLTTIDFARLPISDPSFVDDFKARHHDAETIKRYVEYHAWNTVENLGAHADVNIRTRVKDYRSDLDRLGERHESTHSANLALLLLLLYGHLQNSKSAPPPDCPAEDKAHAATFKANLKNMFVSLQSVHHCSRLVGKLQSDIRNYGKGTLAGLFVATPPIGKLASQGDLLMRVQSNLIREGVLASPAVAKERAADKNLPDGDQQGGDKDYTVGSIAGISPILDLHGSSLPKHRVEFERLVFRERDPFVLAAVSLAAQLVNQKYRRNTAPSFHANCWDLLRHFAGYYGSESDESWTGFTKWRDDKSPWKLSGVDPNEISNWVWMRRFIQQYSNERFLKLFGFPEDESRAHLTAAGIYKRLRTMLFFPMEQKSVGNLAWDHGRFDLLGCRLDCRFRSQTFALYEELWAMGDPFLDHDNKVYWRDRKEGKEMFQATASGADLDTSRKRTRWLCLRTNQSANEPYSAMQIAALADPDAFRSGFWSDSLYNLGLARLVFMKMLGTIEPGIVNSEAGFAAQYRLAAMRRGRFRHLYADWQAHANRVRNLSHVGLLDHAAEFFDSTVSEAEADYLGRCFGLYLGEPVIENLIKDLEIENAQPKGKQGTTRVLLGRVLNPDCLPKYVESARNYTKEWEQLPTMSSPVYPVPKHSLNDMISALSKFGMSELAVGVTIPEAPDVSNCKWPVVWIDEELSKRFESLTAKGAAATHEQMIQWLLSFHRQQKDFLFGGGLKLVDHMKKENSLRNKENVLHRLMNYVLLFRPEMDAPNGTDGAATERIRAWTAYDFFYYLRSLVPIEIQVRTQSMGVWADQYHDAVYKGHETPPGGEFSRKRMDAAAFDVQDLDRDMDVNMQRYIERKVTADKAKTGRMQQ